MRSCPVGFLCNREFQRNILLHKKVSRSCINLMQETEDYMSYAVPLSFHESTFIHSRIRDKSLYPLLVTVESVCSYSHLCFLFYYKRFQAAAPRRVLQILSAVSHQTTALCAPVPVYYSLSKHFSYFFVVITLSFLP